MLGCYFLHCSNEREGSQVYAVLPLPRRYFRPVSRDLKRDWRDTSTARDYPHSANSFSNMNLASNVQPVPKVSDTRRMGGGWDPTLCGRNPRTHFY